ncbi:MAG: heparinase II/III family protein, partial [bacterium]
HQIILDRLLDCINLVQNNLLFEDQDPLLQLMEEKAKKMIGWLNQMTFSNGQIPMLNDSASGIAPTTQKLNNYAKSLDLTTETKPKEIRSNQCNLDDSGYRRFNGTNYECIIDIGPIAPSYQPGHAHADTFNFVLNLYNQPYIVDTGVSTYNPGETRLKERGTSAHNTVTIMDENSSEIWGSFRVARRAKVDIIKDHENHFIAQHNGYRKLKTIHQREWSFSESQINILDTIKGKCKEGKAHFWISPSIIPEIKNQKVYSENGVMTFQNAVSVELVGTQIPDGFNLFSDNYKIEVVFKHYLKTTIKIR